MSKWKKSERCRFCQKETTAYYQRRHAEPGTIPMVYIKTEYCLTCGVSNKEKIRSLGVIHPKVNYNELRECHERKPCQLCFKYKKIDARLICPIINGGDQISIERCKFNEYPNLEPLELALNFPILYTLDPNTIIN